MIEFSFAVPRHGFTVVAAGNLQSGITLLTGQSGSGKTTILKSLAGLITPLEGYIKANGIPWFDKEQNLFVPPRMRRVGYMPQGNIVFPHLSVEHNICYSRRGDETLYEDILDRLGLRKYRHMKARTLSGGEQQRVALGRALYAAPDILLLDEPLSSLDPELRISLGRELITVIEEWEIPCLWVTHDPHFIQGAPMVHWTIDEGKLRSL